jgi:inorganic pyrophosphatase
MSNAGCLLLSRLPRLDAPSRDVPAVIETPKGRPNKYDYDDGGAAFRLLAVMPEGTTFPYDFGFPIHLGDNGNPQNVLVLLDVPVPVRCVSTVRLIIIEAKQRRKCEDWFRNDRLLAVATHAHTQEHIQTIDDLRPHCRGSN